MRCLSCLLAFIILIFAGACATDSPLPEPEPAADIIPFRKDDTLVFLRDGERQLEIAIEIAETDSARTRGLMQRMALPERSGMLFIFEEEGPRSFWMANTPLALDLLFVNADSQVVSIAKYTKPLSPQNVTSSAPARFVIEVEAGFVDTHGLIEGDHVRWNQAAAVPAF